MDLARERLWHLETWLLEDDLMRRAGNRQGMSADAFEEQRSQHVRYAIFGRVSGTYSDGRGDARPGYKRLE